MTDQYWLNETVVQAAKGLKFYLGTLDEDAVSLNLRRELVLYFQARLTPNLDDADVILQQNTQPSGFAIAQVDQQVVIGAGNNGDLLHGMYYYLMHRVIGDLELPCVQVPSQALRMLNHWDNFDGTIERGYAGRSIFYENNHFRGDMSRVIAYARMLASVGINALSINNVNVGPEETKFISGERLKHVADLATIFRGFGIRVFLSVNFASPLDFGDCDTADPLSQDVQAWWQKAAGTIYATVPDFGGFLVKADSEGQPGPFYYGRDHADGANMLAQALAPYGGLVIWRAFVYNNQQDWRDRKADRARAAYDHFKALDGKFLDNVILQVKFGPIDFQPREPVQPLFGALKHTNLLIEFQVTQEYTGHQIDTNYLATQWTSLLRFDTEADGHTLLLQDVPAQTSPQPTNSGIVAISSIGRDENWTGNKLMQANIFAFGRLGWNSALSDTEILREWTRLTFKNETAQKVVEQIMAASNQAYADYTAPLGVGFMVDNMGHYGPGVNDYEYDRWGTYHHADQLGVGVDRTVATGTGYAGQYAPRNATMYEDLATCPDEFLLFFHHVPYTHVLHSGKTVIQHVYDTHFEGCAQAEGFARAWQTVKDVVAPEVFANVEERLARQVHDAREWRDQVNTYFWRMSRIPDAHQRTIYP